MALKSAITDSGSENAVATVLNKAGHAVAATLTWSASPAGLVTQGAVSADTLSTVFVAIAGASGTVTVTATDAASGVSGTGTFEITADVTPATITIALTPV